MLGMPNERSEDMKDEAKGSICIYIYMCNYSEYIYIYTHKISYIYDIYITHVWQLLTYLPKLVFFAVHKRLLPLYDAQKHF